MLRISGTGMQYKRWVYIMNYKELSDEAKEHAFEQFQSYAVSGDYDWWENTFCDWVTKLESLGIYTDNNQIHFSGFGSQGDGACFTGRINLKEFLEAHPEILRQNVDLYMSTVPFDISDEEAPQYEVFIDRYANSRYSHENTVRLDWNVFCGGDAEEARGIHECYMSNADEDIISTCREYMRQLYRELEAEYEYMQSMECFLESVDYKTFDEEGELT